jgi:hypothetical protein
MFQMRTVEKNETHFICSTFNVILMVFEIIKKQLIRIARIATQCIYFQSYRVDILCLLIYIPGLYR